MDTAANNFTVTVDIALPNGTAWQAKEIVAESLKDRDYYADVYRVVPTYEYSPRLTNEVKVALVKQTSWETRLHEAHKRQALKQYPFFTAEDRQLARTFTACAVGELITVPGVRTEEQICSPLTDYDDVMYRLGIAFNNAVQADDIDQADCINRAIFTFSKIFLKNLSQLTLSEQYKEG